jgi:uncharacterized cupin superfamily protein
MGGAIVEASRVQNDWRQRGFSCALWTDPPGQVWADFVHPVDELFLPVEGELELTVQGRTWRPALGEEVFIPAGAPHTVRNVGGTTSRWWYGYRTRLPADAPRSGRTRRANDRPASRQPPDREPPP